MAFNLIDERWIPVERRSGKMEMIAPAQLVEREDPPLRVASARPDFDGALLEFLIGLAQTAAAPATEREWERLLESPPVVAALKRKLDAVRDAFFLDGDGPRFMQDLKVEKDAKADRKPIGALLIDRIGEKELGEPPTLFAKPGRFESLGFPAAAAALMALQTYAPEGGRGQLTSLRGGGPLTTLVTAGDLWTTVWANVLPRPAFERAVPGDPGKTSDGAVFPWMAPTRTSGRRTTPDDVHPLQHLWGLPRRFRLDMSGARSGRCAVSGAEGVPVVDSIFTRPDGTNYDGDYRHPWSPYSLAKPTAPWNPKKASPDGLPYREWPLLVVGSETQRPATVVTYFASLSRRSELIPGARLLAHGYAMKSMKPLRWCRAETPLIRVTGEFAGAFAEAVGGAVTASDEVRKTLAGQVRSAWRDRVEDLDVLAVFGRVSPAFWSDTEPAFFAAVQELKAGLEQNHQPRIDAAKERWLGDLHHAALRLLDRLVEVSADLAAPDLRRAVQARARLQRFTRPTVQKLRKLLSLPVDEPPGLERVGKHRKTRKEKGS